jgi:hypothetical protein
MKRVKLMELSEDDLEQLERYRNLADPPPEYYAFFHQLPRRVQREISKVMSRATFTSSTAKEIMEWNERGELYEAAMPAIFPNGFPWRDPS